MQEKIYQAKQKLNDIIQQKEKVEAVLLQYQSKIITSHKLYENYHNLTTYINELNKYVKDFREECDHSENSGQGRLLYEQILSQLVKVQELSNRVKDELNNAQQKANNKSGRNWQTFNENYQDDPLIDIQTDKSKLQLQQDDETDATQAFNDMNKLESEIVQINEMFTSIAGFVHEQGDMVDRIEANVETAHVQIESANSQLGKAVGHKQSARKKKIICFVILCAAILIIALIIYLSLRN